MGTRWYLPAMRMASMRRIVRSLPVVVMVGTTLAACAAVGGGGDLDSDCDADVSGSELTPVAMSGGASAGVSCNNNEFVDTDLDAFAYSPLFGGPIVEVDCFQEGDEGTGASYRLFQVVNGIPTERLSGPCDGDSETGPNVEGSRYVLVIEHPASSQLVHFLVTARI